MEAAGIRIESSDPDNGITLEGPLAAAVRRAAYLYRQPTNEQRMSVAAKWLTQAATVAASMAGVKFPKEEPPPQAPPPMGRTTEPTPTPPSTVPQSY